MAFPSYTNRSLVSHFKQHSFEMDIQKKKQHLPQSTAASSEAKSQENRDEDYDQESEEGRDHCTLR